ncbi:hypothetical protein DYB32_008124 [Aphanomyces invadans]|uniref:Uncharacterized protein n=1 Tax=Aphanomyces invadans TaxID=157072 RepID=A0A3R7A4R5_9STRA|nr:hypothetical protein DYB32_008124 [Aphanomyces invadans]
MNYCAGLKGNYSVPDVSIPVRFAAVDDGVTFLRGNALTHFFTNDTVNDLPSKTSTMADLAVLGFHAARIQADLRMTTALVIKNTSSVQSIALPSYRIYSKSFCTGCIPMTTMGRGACNMTVKYVHATKTVEVSDSFSIPGSMYDFGLMMSWGVHDTIGTLLKYCALFIATAGYLASRKTIQWHDPDKIDTVTTKLVDMVFPKCLPHLSHAMRFDLFCYNSDMFVLLSVASNVLDMDKGIQYIREVNSFNSQSPQWSMSIQLLALSTRLLWLNLGLVKAAKVLVRLVSSSSYCGENQVMKLLNFSSVTTLYFSAVLLFYVPPYVEYNNSVRWDVSNRIENLDGCSIPSFSSFYYRTAPAIAIGLTLNVVAVLAVDHIVLFKRWRALGSNSLGRQLMYNSTSVSCDFVFDYAIEADGACVIRCKARKLSTLQWYFMTHMQCFCLPEKYARKSMVASIEAVKRAEGAACESNEVLHAIHQSEGGHVHLLDDALASVDALAFKTKVLENATVSIH